MRSPISFIVQHTFTVLRMAPQIISHLKRLISGPMCRNADFQQNKITFLQGFNFDSPDKSVVFFIIPRSFARVAVFRIHVLIKKKRVSDRQHGKVENNREKTDLHKSKKRNVLVRRKINSVFRKITLSNLPRLHIHIHRSQQGRPVRQRGHTVFPF